MELKKFEEKLWLSSPTMHGEEREFVRMAFDTNWISTVGANLNGLEEEMSEYIGCGHAVALSSGTAALHLAIHLAGIKPGDRVFCSDLTFSATVNPVLYEKGTPIFIDSEGETWNMNPDALRKAFEKYPNTKAVIAVNLYGTPAKLDEIKNVCEEYGAVLIEDAAESLGAVYKGRQTGTFGTYNCISFNGNKIITASGGGMLLTDDERAADLARKWSTQSREKAPWYQHKDIGYNYRLSNVLAGIGRGQLLHLEEHIAKKKEIYERYKEGFRNLPISMNPYDGQKSEPNFWLSCLLIDKSAMCRQVRSEDDALYLEETGKSCPTQILEKLTDYNAEGRPIWKPMHMQPVYKSFDFITEKEEGSVSEDIFARGVCLPSDIKMTGAQQKMVIEMVKSCFE